MTGLPRLIATEEAFAPIEYIDAFLDLTRTVDTATSRYLAIYYQQAEAVRQLTDLDYRLAEMDAHDVAMHLIGITGPGVQAFDAPFGTELATLANDTLAAAIRRHPTRFAGLAAVAPQDPAAAAREVDRAMGSLGMNGIIINSHTHGEYLDDPRFWPIFEAAVAHDAAIYLHPTFPSAAMIEPYSKYGMMGALWGFGADTSLHAVRSRDANAGRKDKEINATLGAHRETKGHSEMDTNSARAPKAQVNSVGSLTHIYMRGDTALPRVIRLDGILARRRFAPSATDQLYPDAELPTFGLCVRKGGGIGTWVVMVQRRKRRFV